MKKPLATIILLVLFWAVPNSRAAMQVRPQILHHDLRVSLHPEEQSLRGIDTLTVRMNGADRLTLFLTPKAQVDEARIGTVPVPYAYENGRLVVTLPEQTSRPEFVVEIGYRAVFADPVPEQPLHTEDPTYGVTGAITDRGTFLSGGSGWYPDIPGSLATFRIRVEGPPGTAGVTSGRLVDWCETDGRSHTVWQTAARIPALSLAAGPFRLRQEMAGDIPIYTFFRKETESLASTYLQAAKGYLELYQELFGPYPFEKFAVVENFFPTGYGFPSWTLLGSSVVRLPFIVETSLGHEIAHSWWGNGVRVDASGGNWAEGLTTYVADHLYKERTSAADGREYRLKILRDYATLTAPGDDFPLRGFAGRSSSAGQAVGYGKAAMVFHMARRLLGEDAFWGSLQEIARTKMSQKISWGDFAAVWEHLGQRPFATFVSEWVDRPGAPVLGLEEVEASREGEHWRVSGQLLQQAPFFALTVPMRLETEVGSVEAAIEAQGLQTPFTLYASAPPRRLIVDPEVDLFRRLHPSEIPPTVNGIRGSKDLLVVASRALPEETLAASRTLLSALRQEQAPLGREETLSAADLTGHDLLFLGLPADPDLLPPLPGMLTLSSGGFVLEGQSYGDSDAALFAALPHPHDPERVAAVFHPLSADAARKAGRKVPHYGKYSYLAFASGNNRAKGTWPVTTSPTVHLFNHGEGRE